MSTKIDDRWFDLVMMDSARIPEDMKSNLPKGVYVDHAKPKLATLASKEEDSYWILPEDKDSKLSYDVSKWQRYEWEQIKDADHEIKEIENHCFSTMEMFPELATEMFHALTSYTPRPLPEDELTEEGKKARTIHNKVQETPDFKEVRNRCVGSTIAAAHAMKSMMAIMQQSISRKRDRQEKLNKLETERYGHTKTLSQLAQSDLPQSSIDKHSDTIHLKIKAIDYQISKLKNTPEKLDIDKFNTLMSTHSEKLVEEIDDIENMLDCISSIAGKPIDQNDMENVKKNLDLAKMALNLPDIKKAFDLAGRFRKIANDKLKEKCEGTTEMVGITHGDDIQRILPSDMMLLANPVTQYQFARKLFERSLLQYELESKETKGKGPVVALVDVSGSMSGFKEQYAAATIIALISIATKQKRQLEIYHFNTEIISKIIWDKNDNIYESMNKVIHPASGGSTNIVKCLKETIIDTIKTVKNTDLKADIVLITDGEDTVNHSTVNKLKKNADIRVNTIMCKGHNEGLKKASDIYVHAHKDIDAVENIFEGVVS